MRLIDADFLLEQCDLKNATKYGNKTSKQQEHSYSTLMMYEIADMIDDAPTAFDLKGVIKDFESKLERTKTMLEVLNIHADKDSLSVKNDILFFRERAERYEEFLEILKSAANATNGKNGG